MHPPLNLNLNSNPSYNITIEDLPSYLLTTYDALLFTGSDSQLTHQHLKTSHRSLSILKSFLVGATLGTGDSKQAGSSFIGLQQRLELNATMILLRWFSMVSHRILNQDPSTTDQDDIEIVRQAITAITIIQGLLHLHPPSQKLFGSQFNLKILLNFLSPSLEASWLQSLALPLLDLLVTTFIDCPFNKQLFESTGGLEILVKAMKNRGIRKDVRVKVLETVWGWWIDEESDESPQPPALFQPGLATPAVKRGRNQSSPASTPMRGIGVEIEKEVFELRRSGVRADSVDRGAHAGTRDQPAAVTPGNSRLRPNSLPPLNDPQLASGHENGHLDNTPRASHAGFRARNMSVDGDTPTSASTHRFQPTPSDRARLAFPERTQPQSSSPMLKSSSAGLLATPAPARSGDPTMRLRQMLENTASDFVPATPRHPRTRPTPRKDRDQLILSPSRRGLHRSHPARRYSTHLSSESEEIPEETDEEARDTTSTPTKLFISKSRRTAAAQGGNTPQRMLRHKQSASLGSIPRQPMSERDDPFGATSGGANRAEKRRSRTDLPPLEAAPRRPSSRSSSETSPPRQQPAPPPRVTRGSQGVQRTLRPSGLSVGAEESKPATPSSRAAQTPNPHSRPLTPSSYSRPLTPASNRHLKPTTSAPPRAGVSSPQTPLASPRKTFVTKPAAGASGVNASDVEQMINGSEDSDRPKAGRTLEKYMANSEQLLKRFEEMKVGLNLVIGHGKPLKTPAKGMLS
ncbi:hypothetical protein CROQUDRAFT_667824 [Cronartium quercuum f. sp. fusiforme G11]|uniref:Uncharacterized protein n=1 Tax=Cronartium quercuum f. sp. fusiforme G11 TaxID=708437 RepID=A0A9P6NT74_9BASI|nr:hypothetical protein CROQUDRAFT_667824 [Cronartium quercuum f. sp. fusiforme G11]